jgi:two-component system, sensor histidine kinase YesM
MKKKKCGFSKLLNNFNVRTKLLLSFFCAVFIPVIILGIIFINRTVELTREYTVRDFLVDVNRIEKNITDILEIAKTLSDRFYVDERLENILLKNFTSLFELTQVLNSYTDFDYYIQIYKEIHAVRVYTTNPAIKENWRFMTVTDQIMDTSWYQQVVENKGKLSWTIVTGEDQETILLRLSRPMPVYEGMPFSILTVDIDTSVFSSLFNEEAGLIMFLLNVPGLDTRDLITFGGKAEIKPGMTREEIVLTSKNIADEKKSIISINSKSFFKITRFLGQSDYLLPFSFTALIPMDELNANKQSMFLTGFIFTLICLVVSIILIYIFSHFLLSKRIRFLSTEMHKIASGNLDISLELEGKDEIGYLSRDIMKMINSLKELMKKVYKAELQQKQFEVKQKDMAFKLLSSQINPHFFFNALETIRAKARSNRIGELEEIVKALGRIMRKSLEIQQNPVSINSEIDFTLHYLEIQKYRYEEKLEYEIAVNENIKNIYVIPHLLQPVVENAIIHGIEQKIGGGKITITSKREDSSIILTVKDNGIGIEKEKLKKIQQALLSDALPEKISTTELQYGAHGIGLLNVHHRIQLYYGQPYGIRIQSAINKGTKVDIILPWTGGD